MASSFVVEAARGRAAGVAPMMTMAAAMSLALALGLSSRAEAQSCVTCRTSKCPAMFWIPQCKGKAPEEAAKPAGGGRACAADEQLTVEADVPPRITEGSVVGLRMKTSCEAWLVVLDVEDGGAAGVLLPSSTDPAPRAAPGQPARFPSAAQVRARAHVEAQLRDPSTPSRESLVIFAFADKADFERLKPEPESTHEDGAAFVAALRRKIAALPRTRWAELTARFVIEPRAKPGPAR